MKSLVAIKEDKEFFFFKLYIVLKISVMTALVIGAGYAFVHAGGGYLTVPEHFKANVFDPDQPFGQELLRHRHDIFWYWINRGTVLAGISFVLLTLILTGVSMFIKKKSN